MARVTSWEGLRETVALVLAQAAGMLAVAAALLGVVCSALEPLVTRCGPECERLHAQLWLYVVVAAAAVPLLVLTAVALARGAEGKRRCWGRAGGREGGRGNRQAGKNFTPVARGGR